MSEDETITRVCECGACDQTFTEPMDPHARDSENATAEGLYCSQACANHAGGELHVAQAEHRGGR